MPCLHNNITGDARRADFHRRCDIPPLYPVVGPCECIILGIIGLLFGIGERLLWLL